MDELTSPPAELQFGPDRRLSALAGLGALVLVVVVAMTDDPGGRYLWAVAALVLAGYAVGDLVFWPRLRVDATGLRVRSPLARHDLRWSEVEQVRADVRNRYGLRSTALEVDAGETLVVLSRRALGADPERVAALVRSIAPRA